MDGSQKLPQRLLGTVRDRLAAARRSRTWRSRSPAGCATRAASTSTARRSTWPIRWRRRSRAIAARGARRSRGDRRGLARLSTRSSATTSPRTRVPRGRRRDVVALFATARRDAATHLRASPTSPQTPTPRNRHGRIPLNLHPDRLFPADPATRALARALYATVKDLPIVSPHGHTDPQWFADDEPFANASALFITPDHYVFRMLYSQGVRLEDLGIPRRDGGAGRDRTRARSGARSPSTGTSSAARRRGCGSTTRSTTVFGIDERLTAGIRRPLFRPHQRVPRAAGVPAARAVRALQHRGDRDDRVAARSARAS